MTTAAPKPRQSRRMVPKAVRRLLFFAVVLYFAPLGVLSAFQRSLIFNARHSRQKIEAIQKGIASPPKGAWRVQFRTDAGARITAYYGHALMADGKADLNYSRRPTLLFFYGKGGSLAGSRHLFQSLRRLDANVLMPDYAGFGLSGGQESEANCFATAQASYEYVRSQPETDQNSLVIAGFSLGSGVAVDLAAHEMSAHQPVAGLALFAAYTSLADEAHQEYPIYPTFLLRLLLKYPFDSEQKMPHVVCPSLIVHSLDDRLIPFWMSDRLAEASGGPVTRLTVTGADHADYFFGSQGQAVFSTLSRFLGKNNCLP